MAIELSPSGLSKPQSGDTGANFFEALEAVVQFANDHDHDGVTSNAIGNSTQNILGSEWSASATNGLYSQTVFLPSGKTYDAVQMGFRVNGTVGTAINPQIFPTVEKVSSTSYKIYMNTNVYSLIAIYTG